MTFEAVDGESSVCVVQFAKVPKLGYVKTRTTPELTPEQALKLHQCLMGFTQKQLSSGQWDYYLWLSEPGYDQGVVAALGVESESIDYQTGGDLGERMYQCFQQLLLRYQYVVLVGSDCPYLDEEHIAEVVQTLQNTPCVLTPADDGGYVLIALSRVTDALFQGVPWGGDRVLAVTEEKLRRLGWDYHLMSHLMDIDTAEDLAQLLNDDISQAVLGSLRAEFVSQLSAVAVP